MMTALSLNVIITMMRMNTIRPISRDTMAVTSTGFTIPGTATTTMIHGTQAPGFR